MNNAILFVALILGGTTLLSWPLGRYMKWAMDPAAPESGWAGRFQRAFTFFGGSVSREPQDWKRYAVSLLVFNALMFIVCAAILATQQYLPLNPDGKGALSWHLIFNTAASFTTNTNLQHYSGEVSMSYLSQLFALMWLQFVSAATGIAALAAMARGLAGRKDMGNFFTDLQRASFLVLLPIAFIVAIVLLLNGVPMTLDGSANAVTLEGVAQTIARGPAAGFVAIKQLGTNGGGFFGPNSAHPFENPTFWTNVVSTMCIIQISMASVWMFGHIVRRMRHSVVVFAAMMAMLVVTISSAIWLETEPTQAFASLPVEQNMNLEGKELRFGPTAGPAWAVITTVTSNGSVDSMHDSLNPLTGLMPMIGMWLNSIFGGVGVGMINMFVFIILAVFIAGMMTGRTPEYLNRRVESHEIKLAALSMLAHAFFILVSAAIFAAGPWGLATLNNTGPHGFSEILYEFTSSSANNGSGFEGLGDNTVPWNVATGIVMLVMRYIPIILPLAIAGSMSVKRATAQSAGTLGVEDATFGMMLVATVVFLGALIFFPAASLGPIAEHLMFMR